MSISSIKHLVVAAPYPGPGALVPANKDAEKAETGSEALSSAKKNRSPLTAVEKVNSATHEQRRQHSDKRLAPALFNETPAGSRSMPGPQILAELINRMGGAGMYPEPGQVINISI